MVNPRLIGYDTENTATLMTNLKKKRILQSEFEKKESGKLKSCKKLLELPVAELPVQSEQAEPEQCK